METKKLLMIILAHNDKNSLSELVQNCRHFCPKSRLLLYNSGTDSNLSQGLDLEVLPVSRLQKYSRITPFFFDVFEWLIKNSIEYDYVINLETDMLFIRHGFEDWISSEMLEYDYMTPNLVKFISPKSKWRPYKSLKPELSDWYDFFNFEYVHGGFSPGQIFSKGFINKLIHHECYPNLKQLIASNQSFTLQEILFPTLPDFLQVTGRAYPIELTSINRYRPYQAVSGIVKAINTPNAYFVHPVRRNFDDPARTLIRSLQNI